MSMGSETDFRLADTLSSARPDDMTRAGLAFGAQEAKKAIIALGEVVTRDQAAIWISRTIDNRCEELRDVGASYNDVEVWRSACRTNFLAKMRRVLVD